MSANCSARSRANILGTNSPSTTCRKLISENAAITITIAASCDMASALLSPVKTEAIGRSSFAIVGSPSHPKASDANVTPSWTAEMKRVGLSKSRRTAAAPPEVPSSAIFCIRVRRTDTSANSDATKNAFKATIRKMIKTSRITSVRVIDASDSVFCRKKRKLLLAGSSIVWSIVFLRHFH